MADFDNFFINLGFRIDSASQAKAEAAQAATETKLTAVAEAGAKKRLTYEEENAKRRAAIIANFRKMMGLEAEKTGDVQDKARKKDAEKDNRTADDLAKRAKERRAAAAKQMQEHAIRLASFATAAIAGVEAVAVGVVYAAEKAARSLEKMGYAARLSGTTPAGMNGAAYAASQLGSSAEASNAALKSFGEKMKNNPGFQDVFRVFTGKSALDAKGNLLNASELLAILGDRLREVEKSGGPYGRIQALNYAKSYGIDDENEVTAIEDPRYRKMQAEFNKRQAAIGADPNAAVEGATKFEQSLRKLESIADAIKTKVETSVFKDLQPQLDNLATWADKNGDHIATVVTNIVEGLLKLATNVVVALSKIDWDSVLTKVEKFATDFDVLATKYFGENGTLIATFTLFGALVQTRLLGPLGLIRAALAGLSAIPLPGWFLAFTAASGAAQWKGAQDTTKVLQHDDPTKNDVVTDPTSGFAQNVEPGAGNQVVGTADPKTGWFQRLQRFLGFGGADERRVQDAILSTADSTKKIADATGGGPGGSGGGGGDGFGGGVLSSANRVLRNLGAAAGAGFRGGGSTPAKGALAANQKEAYAAAIGEGLSPTAARALVANMSGEGLAVPHDYHWDGKHYSGGIVQWDPQRSAAIKAKFGKNPWELSVTDQTRAAIWEYRNNPAYAATKRAMEGDNAAEMIGALVDNYENPGNHARAKAQRFGFYRGFNPDAPKAASPAPTAMAPVPAGTSAKAITDSEVFAARQRLAAGGSDPKDKALVARYLKQQNSKHSSMLDDIHRKIAAGHLVIPKSSTPFGVSMSHQYAINNSRTHGDTNITHNPVFNIQGGNIQMAMDQARKAASRGNADLLRNMQTINS